MRDDEPGVELSLAISPEPTRTERDAVIAALVALGRRRPPATPASRVRRTGWQTMARREAIGVGSNDPGWSSDDSERAMSGRKTTGPEGTG